MLKMIPGICVPSLAAQTSWIKLIHIYMLKVGMVKDFALFFEAFKWEMCYFWGKWNFKYDFTGYWIFIWIQHISPNRHGGNGPIFKNLVPLVSSCHVEVSFNMQIWVWAELGARGTHSLNLDVLQKIDIFAHLFIFEIFI